MTPKSHNGGPHEKPTTTMSPDMQECYKPKTTCPRRSPRPALVLPEPPLLFKARVLKPSTKNPGLIPLTSPSRTQEPESRASNKSNRNLESAKRAQNRLTPHLEPRTPRSAASAQQEEHPDLIEPTAAKEPSAPKAPPPPQVLQANIVKRETLALHNRSKKSIGT